MEVKILSQYAGEPSLLRELDGLLSTNEYTLFRVLVAYVSVSGLKALEDRISEFLEKKGNFLDWIVGVDQEVTGKDALEYLLYLKNKYPKSVRIRIFTAGND